MIQINKNKQLKRLQFCEYENDYAPVNSHDSCINN